ncbi:MULTISPECIES: cryptochrome/photolyase family protein [Halomicrobium]|uniref:Deoxyribodipyrimidine photo-lyase n=2 Tax=Halomicrobium mukohataei TaxID=57705 RepID=C7NYW0_HALMD|nr:MULTISPECIES: deoxyribodipyrimidine photo-lyase [Halomicrobium]ACV48649.1 Deoxyribodipyrimidine photo-lyase [Halomicrobium mukohataei DSM 12286]QCD67048.1 deoxyribodipyrimidine photo-lyase [Halomicrobium mukohataei]QFR21858.1 deoxyribodipyrimidine photo-lyase [Halomicrobium sp. ZPS1]
MRIHWHRRDLRTTDNAGLAAATADSPVVPVFVFDDAVLDHAAPPRVAFMLDALDSLRAQYRDRGSDLVIAHGDPTAEIPRLAEAFGADGVTWGEAYSGLGIERDIAVRQALDDVGVEREAVTDSVHHRPGEITTNDGDPYSVFTYFGRKWHDREKEDPYDAPGPDELADVSGDPLPSVGDLGFEEPQAEIPPAGTEPARELLDAFCEDDIYRYEDRRDYPADDCTSRLSAHLKFGTIGIREVYERTASAAAAADDEERRESVAEFQSQLAWREFYTQVLFANRSVVTDNYKTYERPLQWRDDPEALQAWKDGETGYPIVDAGMRQLRQEAFVHNRVRMIVASFLTKDLLIDWRAGYEWFKERLVDHDTANDNGGWQWAASTGTDAQPYFRIFNPMTQGERYDPDAEYIKTYVPELRDAEPSVIHEWPDLSLTQRRNAAPEYPDPIVDHSERRDQALEMFETARGES